MNFFANEKEEDKTNTKEEDKIKNKKGTEENKEKEKPSSSSEETKTTSVEKKNNFRRKKCKNQEHKFFTLKLLKEQKTLKNPQKSFKMPCMNSKLEESKPKYEVQKMLVYEPSKSEIEKLKLIPRDRRPRVYVCGPQVMRRSCPPKLCDCPSKSGNFLAKSICFGAKVIAIITTVKIAYDTGVFSGHKKHSKMVRNIHKYAIKAIKEKARETKEKKDKQKKQEEKKDQAVTEYETQWNLANLWNNLVVHFVTGLVNWQTKKNN